MYFDVVVGTYFKLFKYQYNIKEEILVQYLYFACIGMFFITLGILIAMLVNGIYGERGLDTCFDQRWTVKVNLHTFVGSWLICDQCHVWSVKGCCN